MSLNSQLILKFENGDPIWFALHERVTNLPLLAQLIKKHHGSVVDNIREADFCLISACRPDATEAAARVVEEGGNAIDASWIWESSSLEQLLPWYPYQLGKVNKNPDTSDEMRDTHELATSLARYLPFSPDIGSIYAHLAMRLPHRTATQFKQLHEQRKQAVDACVLHMANQITNITPPIGYFSNSNSHMEINDSGAQNELPISLVTARRPPLSDSFTSSASVTVSRTSMLLESIIPEANHMRARKSDSGRTPKSATFPPVTAAEPLLTSVNPDGGEADPTPVQFPTEEQDIEMGTRVSAEPVLPRVTTSSNPTSRPSNMAPAPAKSMQHDPGKTTQNSRLSQLPRTQAEGSSQSPNELHIPPQNGVVTATMMATEEQTGPLHNASNVGGPSAVSDAQPQKLQRRNLVPASHLLDAMEQEETPDEDESDGGEYVLHTAKVRTRDGDDSDEEERPKRRRKKNRPKDKGAEKVRGENGERKSGRATVPQHQVDAMLQWGSTHPREKGVNQKVYWSRFVEESDIGKERNWASWDAISRHHGRPPILDEPGRAQQFPAIVMPAVGRHPPAPTNPAATFRLVIPPAPGNTNPTEIKGSGTPQVNSTGFNRPLPDKEVHKQHHPEARPKPSHITSMSGRVTGSSESASNEMGRQLHPDTRQEHTSLAGSSGVKISPPTQYKPSVDRPRLVFSFNGSTNDKETSRTQNDVAAPMGSLPKPGLQTGGNASSKVFGGFTHSIRGASNFQSRAWDKDTLPNRPAQ